MTFTTVLFYILAAVLVIAAFRVITARSAVTAVLHLILAFANAAMLWMLLGAEFLALLLVLVYVGAVMVLFLFVVMMLDIRMDTLRQGMKTYLPLGLVIGYLPDFFVKYEVEQGALVPLMPQWRSDDTPVYVIYPAQRHRNPRVMKLVDAMCNRFEDFVRSPIYSVTRIDYGQG